MVRYGGVRVIFYPFYNILLSEESWWKFMNQKQRTKKNHRPFEANKATCFSICMWIILITVPQLNASTSTGNVTLANLIIGCEHHSCSFVNVVTTRGAFLILCHKKCDPTWINSLRETISTQFYWVWPYNLFITFVFYLKSYCFCWSLSFQCY